MIELLAGVLVLGALVFLGFPLLMWGVLRDSAGLSPKIQRAAQEFLSSPRAHHFEPFDASRHPSPSAVTTYLRDNAARLKAEDFRQVGDLVRPYGTMTTRVVLLDQPDGVVATIAVVSSEQGMAAPMVAFTAELADGRMLDVDNSTSPSLLARRPGRETYRFPAVRDPARLYQIFQVLLRRRFGSAGLRQHDIAADPARYLAETADAEYQAQVGAGYFGLDEQTLRFRVTLKGAYFVTWKGLPPIRQLRQAALSRQAQQVLREIGMDGRDERAVADPPTVPADSLHDRLIGVGGVILILTLIVGTIVRHSAPVASWPACCSKPWRTLIDAGLVAGLVVAALGFLLQFLHRRRHLHRGAARPVRAADRPAPPGGFRRADFEAKAVVFARGQARRVWMVAVPVFVGLPALYALDLVAPTPHEPPSFAGLFIVLGIIGVSAAANLVMATRLARRLGLVCSACRLAFALSRGRYHLVDWVLETGLCPGCGKQLLDGLEVGPMLNPPKHGLVVPFVLSALAGAAIVTFAFAMNADRVRSCRGLYAAALSAADSAAVYARPLASSGSITCGTLRVVGRLPASPG